MAQDASRTSPAHSASAPLRKAVSPEWRPPITIATAASTSISALTRSFATAANIAIPPRITMQKTDRRISSSTTNSRTNGSGTLVDVTESTGLDHNNNRFSFAPVWCDYNGDGWPDLFVANDFGRKNLYRNQRGKFRDIAAEAGVEISATA
jgi:hypothetical protein